MNSAQFANYDCRKATCCGEDDPFPNFTQDRIGYRPGQEQLVCVSQYFAPLPVPGVLAVSTLAGLNLMTIGVSVLISDEAACGEEGTSESESYVEAVQQVIEDVGVPPTPEAPEAPPSPAVANTEQTACSTCGDGTITCVTVSAGLYLGATEAEANAQALAIATSRANAWRICCDPAPLFCCVGRSYFFTLGLIGGLSPKTITLYSGALPDGLSISGAAISGTPTVAGTFTFTVEISDGRVLSYKTIVMHAVEIVPTSLPNVVLGDYYSAQITANGVPGGYTATFSITGGALPSGLSLAGDGWITGTPVGGVPATFTIGVTIA